MTKKSPKIAALLAALPPDPRHDAHYTGYFACFNQGLYYEAHDVLEELWLADRKGIDGDFYKGLIQFAGAFVHLQKNRLGPSSNLFGLALANLEKYPSPHRDLDTASVRALCRKRREELAASGFTRNPLAEGAPRLEISPA